MNSKVLGAVAGVLTLLAMGEAHAQAPPDPAKGAKIFKTQCSTCHKAEKGAGVLTGPPLFGVVGRKSATVPGFAYSPAMKKTAWVWSTAQLTKYLKAPMTMVPGTKMAFVGLKKPGDSEAVAAYLATLK